MPITLKSTQINIKGPDGYIPLDAFAEETTNEKIAAINTAAAQKISAIETKGAQTLASIPQDYTSLENEVGELKSDLIYNTETFPIHLDITKNENDATSNKCVNGETGGLIPANGYKTTQYIFVDEYSELFFIAPIATSAGDSGYAFYDENNNYIEGEPYPITSIENANKLYRVSVPSNAKYFRFAFRFAQLDIIKNGIRGILKEPVKKYYNNREELEYTECVDGAIIANSSADYVNGTCMNYHSSNLPQYATSVICVKNIKTVEYKLPFFTDASSWGSAFYDENMNFISGRTIRAGIEGNYETVFDSVPVNAFYFRTTYTHATRLPIIGYTNIERFDIYVAASDSPNRFKNSADLVCTGTNDEQVIQRAINMAKPTGSVIFAVGTYNIDSFQSPTDGGARYAILIPKDRGVIKLISEGFKGNTSGDTAIFKVTQSCYNALDSNVEYDIIRSECNNGNVAFPNSMIYVDGINFDLPGNKKKICCINGWYASTLSVKNVGAVCISSFDNTEIPVDGCVAIRGTQGSNNGTRNEITHCFVFGFYEGFAVSGEHMIVTDCGTRHCWYGFTFNRKNGQNHGAYTHPMTVINCADELSFCMPYFGHNGEYAQTDGLGGRQNITFIDFNLEWLASYWGKSPNGGVLATEEQPGEWYGEIRYTIQTGYGGNSKNSVSQYFWASDGSGKNFKSINGAQKTMCTTAERTSYAPTYAQVVYDTDLGKMVVCVDPINKVWQDFSGNVVQ